MRSNFTQPAGGDHAGVFRHYFTPTDEELVARARGWLANGCVLVRTAYTTDDGKPGVLWWVRSPAGVCWDSLPRRIAETVVDGMGRELERSEAGATVTRFQVRAMSNYIEMGETLARVIRAEAAADRDVHSPQQHRAFEAGAQRLAALINEQGLEKTLLPGIREEAGRMREATARAERVRRELGTLIDPENLDERARGVVALTAAIMGAFVSAQSRDTGGNSRAIQDATYGKMIQATSYIVWAYLTNGSPLPEVSSEE